MIKKFSIFNLMLIVIIVTDFPLQSQAQAPQDTIFVERSFWGNSFFIGGKEFDRSEVVDLLEKNTYSEKLMSTSASKKTWGYILLTAGILMTGDVVLETWRSYNNY